MKLKGSDIVTQVLRERGVTTVFGYPGGNVLPLYDALRKAHEAHGLRHILTASEAGAAHAADGWARATGGVGVCIATSGPGATNLVTGIAAAYMDSSPVVFITGNVPTSQVGTDSFQEVDITGITQPVTKHNVMVKDVRRLAYELNRAFDIAHSGRRGPVLVDIPLDVQTAECEYERVIPTLIVTPPPDVTALDVAAEMILKAERPVILAGGGTVGASDELVRFAEMLNVPVAVTLTALGNMPASHPLYIGMVGLYGSPHAVQTVSASDLVIAVGVRFSDRVASVAADAKPLLHIDIDRSEINKNVRVRHYVVGDAGAALRALTQRVSAAALQGMTARIAVMPCNAGTGGEAAGAAAPPDPRAVLALVRERFGGARVATDVGKHQLWTAQCVPFERPRMWITSAGVGAMGFGMGAAIGASLATGERVVLVTGDGSFIMNSNELATAVALRLPLTVVVLRDDALGMVREQQDSAFASSLTPPDFVMLAEAYGAIGIRASSVAEADAAFERAASMDAPCVVEVLIDPNTPSRVGGDRLTW